MAAPEILDFDTPRGLARVHLHRPACDAPTRAALVLGHGAGGSVSAPDLQAVTARVLRDGIAVALVEQPYRVAGKRSTPRPPVLDEAWVSVLAQLRDGDGPLAGLPLVTGGRSSGARVASRTAKEVGATAVLCLAFPLVPPKRRDGTPAPSRLPELEGAGVPVLVVQGERDRFGLPPADPPRREVVVVPGDHGLKRDLAGTAHIVSAWLEGLDALQG